MELLEEWTEWIAEIIFGPTPHEQLRRTKREVERALTRIQNQRQVYVNKETALVKELRLLAQHATNPAQLAPLAMDIARARTAQAKLHKMCLTMDSVSLTLTAAHSTVMITHATRQATDALKSCGAIAAAHSSREYQKELAKFEIVGEMIEDMNEDTESEECDSNQILAQISAEQNISLAFDLPGVPTFQDMPAVPTRKPTLTPK